VASTPKNVSVQLKVDPEAFTTTMEKLTAAMEGFSAGFAPIAAHAQQVAEQLGKMTLPPGMTLSYPELPEIPVHTNKTPFAIASSFDFGTVNPAAVAMAFGLTEGEQHTGPDGAVWEFHLSGGWRIVQDLASPIDRAPYGWFCTACDLHMTVHKGDPVACDSGGWCRPATSAEHKRTLRGH
jgi:hypothetical protein